MQQRINELDFLKGIFIILMITFHLVYIEDLYPYAKRIVYTFHMPGFLLISGYLMKFRYPWHRFRRTILWFFIPYIIMELGYTLMGSLLPIAEHIDHLTIAVVFENLLFHPIGPYWYLHTIIICGMICYCVFRLVPMSDASRFILLGLVFYWLSCEMKILSFSCSLFFLAGVLVQWNNKDFCSVFKSSPIAIVAFVLLACHPQNLEQSTSGGILMVCLFVSASLFVFQHMSMSVTMPLRRAVLFLGRNTLPIFLFSPIFTILCKLLIPMFLFDPTGILFLCVSLTICLSGSLVIAAIMDSIKLSPLFFGHKKIIK